MKIEAIHLREIQMPLAHPFETSFGVTTGRRILLVEIEADGLSVLGYQRNDRGDGQFQLGRWDETFAY